MNLRPPTPGMRDQELVQWFQRVYDAIKELDSAIKNIPTPEPTPESDIPTSHNQLTENGGNNSHATISQHMATNTAHQSDGPVVGRNELNNSLFAVQQELIALAESIRGIRIWEAPIGGGAIPDNVDFVRCIYGGMGLFLQPAFQQTGRKLTVDNVSSEDISLFVIGDEFQVIEGENQQNIPPDCAVTLVSDGFSWRFV